MLKYSKLQKLRILENDDKIFEDMCEAPKTLQE